MTWVININVHRRQAGNEGSNSGAPGGSRHAPSTGTAVTQLQPGRAPTL